VQHQKELRLKFCHLSKDYTKAQVASISMMPPLPSISFGFGRYLRWPWNKKPRQQPSRTGAK
jgi:hypothetical protein